jgi:hypothetical protein
LEERSAEFLDVSIIRLDQILQVFASGLEIAYVGQRNLRNLRERFTRRETLMTGEPLELKRAAVVLLRPTCLLATSPVAHLIPGLIFSGLILHCRSVAPLQLKAARPRN